MVSGFLISKFGALSHLISSQEEDYIPTSTQKQGRFTEDSSLSPDCSDLKVGHLKTSQHRQRILLQWSPKYSEVFGDFSHIFYQSLVGHLIKLAVSSIFLSISIKSVHLCGSEANLCDFCTGSWQLWSTHSSGAWSGNWSFCGPHVCKWDRSLCNIRIHSNLFVIMIMHRISIISRKKKKRGFLFRKWHLHLRLHFSPFRE